MTAYKYRFEDEDGNTWIKWINARTMREADAKADAIHQDDPRSIGCECVGIKRDWYNAPENAPGM